MAQRYGLVIDLDRCTGCCTCVVACQMEHSLDHVSGIRVETVGGQGRDTPGGNHPLLSMYYLPIPCMHCREARCIEACPLEAIYRRSDGIVAIDDARCNGCEACIEACPYGALVYLPERDRIWKCNLCAHRVDAGLDPFCVLCCEMEAMFFGDVDDPTSRVAELARQKKASVLKPELGTHPAVLYFGGTSADTTFAPSTSSTST